MWRVGWDALSFHSVLLASWALLSGEPFIIWLPVFFSASEKKVTGCFSDTGVWKSCLQTRATAANMPACVRRVMPVLSWQDARSPSDASVPREHPGELGIPEESPGQETRPQVACLSLAGSSYCCSRVQYMWASIWFSSNPQKKNVFPEGC